MAIDQAAPPAEGFSPKPPLPWHPPFICGGSLTCFLIMGEKPSLGGAKPGNSPPTWQGRAGRPVRHWALHGFPPLPVLPGCCVFTRGYIPGQEIKRGSKHTERHQTPENKRHFKVFRNYYFPHWTIDNYCPMREVFKPLSTLV